MELARLMVVDEIGVRTLLRYAVNRIDEEYLTGKTCKALVVAILVPQERLWAARPGPPRQG